MTPTEIKKFASDFRDGLIGTNRKASRSMCALVSIPLQAALEILAGVKSEIVSEDGHTFLVTEYGLLIDPTIDQFSRADEQVDKILIENIGDKKIVCDERLSGFQFIEIIKNFKRLQQSEGCEATAREAGIFVARFIYYPLAQQGFFEGRLE